MAWCVTVPGIGGSGPDHWQSLWELADEEAFVRTELSEREYDEPSRDRWIEAIDRAVRQCDEPPVIVAHSLGCLAVEHWSHVTKTPALGALLVSPPDVEGPAFPSVARDFAHPPQKPLRFPSVLVVSSNDPYLSEAHAVKTARAWGSQLVRVGARGHLSGYDGLGAWPFGRALLEQLRADG